MTSPKVVRNSQTGTIQFPAENTRTKKVSLAGFTNENNIFVILNGCGYTRKGNSNTGYYAVPTAIYLADLTTTQMTLTISGNLDYQETYSYQVFELY